MHGINNTAEENLHGINNNLDVCNIQQINNENIETNLQNQFNSNDINASHNHETLIVQDESFITSNASRSTVNFGFYDANDDSACTTFNSRILNYNENTFDRIGNDFSRFQINKNFLDELNIVGRRIVDIKYFLNSFNNLIAKHHSGVCNDFRLNCRKYVNEGLGTQLLFNCDSCSFEDWVHSEPKQKRMMSINKLAVLSTFVAGTGYEGLNQMCAAMNIPCMAHTTYVRYRQSLAPVIEKAAEDVMKEAAIIEKEEAIKKGHIINGIPYIEVEGDGGYGKRSYRSGKFDSLVCVGVLIGVETKKILHVEIRNKFCLICYKAAKLQQKPALHKCYKNWNYNKSSSSMETDAILKGFQKSVEIHGLLYKTYIGDGDSSTYNSLLENDVYGAYGVRVGRLYCYNHLFRNMCNKIVEASRGKIARAAVVGNIAKFRLFIKKSAFKIRKAITDHIEQRNQEHCTDEQRIKELQRDILNVVDHVFGQHTNCKSRNLNCKTKKTKKNWVPVLKACKIYEPIQLAVKKVSCFSKSLLREVTTNASENFNSIVAKFIGGKRCNYAFLDSYHSRCLCAAIQYNTGCVLTTLSKYIDEDLSIAEVVEAKNQAKILRNRLLRQKQGAKRKVILHEDDKYYGDSHMEPDLAKETYDELVRHHFEQLQEDVRNRDEIEATTRQQSNCDEWHEKRRKLLTASKFGPICKARANTSCVSKVKGILYPQALDLPQFQYGLEMESEAIKLIQNKLKIKVEPVGLIIDRNHPYLAASPDGIIGSEGIIEIKSPSSVAHLTPTQALDKNQRIRTIFSRHNINKMNTNHDYYYQVQGQLHISGRKYCIFILYTQKGIKYVREEYDELFWKKMEPKLTTFYMNCLLPEIIDSRIRRNMPIREPEYILQARCKKENQVKNNRKRKNSKEQVSNNKRQKICKIDVSSAADEIAQDRLNANITIYKLQDQQSFIKKMKNECLQKHEKKNATIQENIGGSIEDVSGILDVDNYNNSCNTKTNQISTIMNNNEYQAVLDVCNLNINVDKVISNVLSSNYLLEDDDVELFMQIVKEYLPDFEIHNVQHFIYLHLLKETNKSKHIQILGGNKFGHWICAYFDGSNLLVYDSLNRLELEFFHSQEKKYFKKRYPNILESEIITVPVTHQPDMRICGIYAAAFVTDIALGNDPALISYSTNGIIMRQHFADIIRTHNLISFPSK